MNKKEYRQVDILDSEKSMDNLIKDLQNANRPFSLKQYKNKNLKCLSQQEIQRKQNNEAVLKKQSLQHTSNNRYCSDTSGNTISLSQDVINIIKESLEKLNQRLDKIEKKENENNLMLRHLYKARNRKVRNMPKCLPFTSIENFVQFNNASDELYNEVVDYFIYLGGLNPIDCAAIYFKHAFESTEKVSLEMTWHGTKCLTALKVTRFAQACEDAMSSNLNFSKPRRNEFEDSMIKALKSTKERFRRHQKSKDLENHMAGEIETEEPVTKKRKNKNQNEEKENMRFYNSANIEPQVEVEKTQNCQRYINENLSDTQLFKNDHFLHTKKQDKDLNDSNAKYDEDSNESYSNIFDDY